MIQLRRDLFENSKINEISFENRVKIKLLHEQGKTQKETAKLVKWFC